MHYFTKKEEIEENTENFITHNQSAKLQRSEYIDIKYYTQKNEWQSIAESKRPKNI